MRLVLDLLRSERRAAVFFATLTQSALGTGASYVALLLLAYERFDSPLAISLVLAADLLPAMLLGPFFGAAADRFSRRTCVVVADVLRAGSFVGIALVDSYTATVLLAVVAGSGTGLFTPAALAALPSLVNRERLPAATSLYGAIADLGFTLGPALAAVLLLVGGAETIMFVNGLTFAVSALVLRALPFGEAPRLEQRRGRRSLVADAIAGARAARILKGLPTLLIASSFAMFFAGSFNVGELLFAKNELGAGESGFSLLVALFGVGFAAGSLAGARGGPLPHLKRRYLAGLLVMGAGFLASGFAPGVVIAMVTFVVAGFGNGLVIVYERLLIQATVPDALAGRVFGLKDALTAWAFGLAFLAAAGLIEAIGVRGAIVFAGAGGLVAWAVAAVMLRSVWRTEEEGSDGRGPDGLGDGAVGEDRPDLVAGRNHWLALLDDLN